MGGVGGRGDRVRGGDPKVMMVSKASFREFSGLKYEAEIVIHSMINVVNAVTGAVAQL